MFTGLIEDVSIVTEIFRADVAAKLSVKTALNTESVAIGDSVAVDGVCLTAIHKQGGTLTFDVSPETLSRSTLCKLGPGSRVNLERALRVGDRLGGHIVSGHVDCIAQLAERRELSRNLLLSFRLPDEFSRYIVSKGSIAIDGISLTVNFVSGGIFSVNIIPHTGAKTTLQDKRPGAEVNIETDILAKYVERLLSGRNQRPGDVSMELLAKSGFL